MPLCPGAPAPPRRAPGPGALTRGARGARVGEPGGLRRTRAGAPRLRRRGTRGARRPWGARSALLVLAFAPPPARGLPAQELDTTALRSDVEERIARHRGRVHLALADAASGRELLSIRGDEPVASASLVKVPLLVEVFHQAEHGALELDGPLVLLEAGKQPGYGILQFLQTVSPEASAAMKEMLARQFYEEGIPRHLPGDVAVAHKTGALSYARHDRGIVEEPRRPYVLSILTTGNDDRGWRLDVEPHLLIADLSRIVHRDVTAGRRR